MKIFSGVPSRRANDTRRSLAPHVARNLIYTRTHQHTARVRIRVGSMDRAWNRRIYIYIRWRAWRVFSLAIYPTNSNNSHKFARSVFGSPPGSPRVSRSVHFSSFSPPSESCSKSQFVPGRVARTILNFVSIVAMHINILSFFSHRFPNKIVRRVTSNAVKRS